MSSKFVLIISAILAVALSQFPDIPDSDIRKISPINDGSYRLPNDTIPIHYEITLAPDFEEFTFIGQVKITIRVVQETNTITLHANLLTINSETIDVRTLDQTLLTVQSTVEEPDFHFFRINLLDTLQVDEILEVTIDYTGILGEDNRGFYRASYVQDGVTKWFGTTQFEATDARRAFPCYDEPALKATFTIHILRPAQYNSVSNMDPISNPIPLNDKYVDSFNETVPMSTYLVAFVVSEMKSTGRLENQAVIAARDLIDDGRGDYGRQTGISILQAMEDFTGIEYSLDKLDQVGLPDLWFASGAMENWGLVTYRERYILWKQGISTSSEKQNVASIIAHELGHQWFGNIVSPLWWTYLWLNEGFATYFEHYATEQVEPTMRMMDQYVTLVNQRAMDNDATTTSRPMSYYAEDPVGIRALFDRIAYQKSGAVIRMMEHFLTSETFKTGLNIYLTNRAYQAAEPKDLWDGLQAAVDQNDPNILGEQTVEEIMENWHTRAGFPVISVSRNEDGMIVLNQTRFFLDGSVTDPEYTTWNVPINYVTNTALNFANTQATLWLNSTEQTTDIEVPENGWIMLNKQATGYYRVNYYEENWRAIINYLHSSNYINIHVANRAQLINDAFNLARSGRLSYRIMLDLFSYLQNETDYVPLYSFFNALDYLNRLLINSGEHYVILQRFVHEMLQAAFVSVNSDISGASTIRLNQINVYTWLCRMGHENCLLLTHLLLTERAIAHPDMQTPVYCGGLITNQNSESNWMYVFNRYRGDEAEALEKSRILSALGCTTSETQLRRWLDIIFGSDEEFSIESADEISAAFTGIVSAHKFGLDTAFDYVLSNFAQINSHLSTQNVSTILNTLSNRLTTDAQLTQLQGLYNSLSAELQTTHQGGFNTAFANIENNIEEAAINLPVIREWLDEYNNGFVFGISIPLLLVALFLQWFT